MLGFVSFGALTPQGFLKFLDLDFDLLLFEVCVLGGKLLKLPLLKFKLFGGWFSMPSLSECGGCLTFVPEFWLRPFSFMKLCIRSFTSCDCTFGEKVALLTCYR